ncbi:MAG: hypothetical protein L0271_05240 [Gemmatimonadetes bacterium]|nr:hypothetical protein [Gemmatimonadota bacterium]
MALILVLVVLLVALLIPLTAVVLDSQVGRAIAARLEGSKLPAGSLPDRVALLEGEVDRLSRELERLNEESAFLQRLLEQKPEAEGLLPPGDRSA